MPIAVDVLRSPGWWMQRLFNMLSDRNRRNRLQLLYDYRRGQPPLPEGAANARSAYEVFQKKARSNFAELIVSAMSERMMPTGFRTALDDDATGDAEVGAMWSRAGLDVTSSDVHDFMLALGEAYVIVGPMDAETQAPIVTCEDPRFMVGEIDPAMPRRLMAALKVMHDDAANEDRAYLYLPGEVWVAVRPAGLLALPSGMTRPGWNEREHQGPNILFDHRSWEWSKERSGKLPHQRMPVVKFTNKYGMGEYEAHLDLLDRINHQILQRMVIATMQAFRQRAVKNLPTHWGDDHPTLAGQEIDYNEIFVADPGAVWQLPAAAEMWESAVNDLRPILEAVKDDLEHLSSVTRTPMYMLSPGGENQSAEGASLVREGLVFKTEDRCTRSSYPWAQVTSLMLTHAGQADRADIGKLQTIWAAVQRLSLTERADAVSKLQLLLPKRTMLITVLGMSPAEADRTMTEIADEQLLAAQVQQALLAAAQPAPGQAGPGGQVNAGVPAQQPAAGPPQPRQPAGAVS